MTAQPRPKKRGASQTFAAGTTFAAGALLLTTALLVLSQGISALRSDGLLVIGTDYAYRLNPTVWGWIHIVLAILMGLVAFGLFFGAAWARIVAIVMASLSIVAMFLWLPYYPVWSIVVIALDIIVIWAVATWDTSRT
ncbi:MAG: hypothetical protein K0U84_06665 [Actinomycetia bacterium]|nr:hypothetical protein [Actinomycetes bacterium]